jgi:hypothetical protein
MKGLENNQDQAEIEGTVIGYGTKGKSDFSQT